MTDEEAREFWRELENKIGEPISIYSMGEYFTGFEEINNPVVGLFFLTETRLFFQTFPRKNWLASISESIRGRKEENEPNTYSLPLNWVRKVELLKPKSFLGRIFASGMTKVSVEYLDEENETCIMQFTLLSKAEDFVKQIELLR
ncbi:MAG: hypothetical protein DRP87_16025 [Spirochaetes bacterium]|nr:MAG: hypothetical protein DRP87_16025 [Spirochaetota bacterium]